MTREKRCSRSTTGHGTALVGSKFASSILIEAETDFSASLAYIEMRIIMAQVLFHFDLELMPESENWLDQKVYLVWEKNPLFVRLKPVA